MDVWLRRIFAACTHIMQNAAEQWGRAARLRAAIWMCGCVAHAATCKRMARPRRWANTAATPRAVWPWCHALATQPLRPAKLAAPSKPSSPQAWLAPHSTAQAAACTAWEGAVREEAASGGTCRGRQHAPWTRPRHGVGSGECRGGSGRALAWQGRAPRSSARRRVIPNFLISLATSTLKIFEALEIFLGFWTVPF